MTSLENKRTLSNRLTTKYLLIIRNEENFAEKTTYSFTYAKIILGIFLIFALMMGISFYLATTLLEKWFDPRFAELKANKQVIEMSSRLDSLISEVEKKDDFINNFKMIMSGRDGEYVEVENEGSIEVWS